MAHTPDADPHPPAPLPLALSLVNGRGRIALARPVTCGGVRLDALQMEIPSIRFPFDLSGGSQRFRNRRCQLRQATLHITLPTIQTWLSRQVGALDSLRGVVLQPEGQQPAQAICITGRVVTAEHSAPFLLRGPLLPAGDRLRLRLLDLWLFGPTLIPTPLVLRQALEGMCSNELVPGARGAQRLTALDGCHDLLFDPLALALDVLPLHGWRIPSRSGILLRSIQLSTSGLRLEFLGPAEAPSEQTSIAVAPHPARWKLALEPDEQLQQAEERIPVSIDEARRMFHQVTDARLWPLVQERLLQFACARPDHDDETLELAASALARDAQCVPALLARAAVMLRQERHDEAASAYRRVAQSCAQVSDTMGEIMALLAAGHSVMDLDAQRARLDFERVLALDPHSTTAINQLARLYAELGQWEHLSHLRLRQLELTSTPEQRLHTHLALGEVYRVHMNDPDRALDQYQRALEIDPECEPAIRGQAEACIDADRLEDAIEVLRQLSATLRRQGDDAAESTVHLRLASLHEHLHQPQLALTALQRVLELRPDEPQTLRRLAVLHEHMDQPRQAIEILEQIQPQVPEDLRPPGLFHLAELYLAVGDVEAARRTTDNLLALDPAHAGAHQLRILLAEQRGGDAVMTALHDALTAESDPARRMELQVRLARLHAEKDDDVDQVVAALTDAAKLGLPAQQLALQWDQIIELRRTRDKPADLARLAERASATFIEAAPRANRYFAAGQLWEQCTPDSLDHAIRCYRAALGDQPHHAHSLDALEAIYTRQADHDQLIQILTVKIEASRPSVQKALLCRLGHLLSGLGRDEDALKACARALTLDADFTPALVFLAREAQQTDRQDDAEQLYRRLAAVLSRGSTGLPQEQRTELLVETHLALAALHRRQGQTREEEGHLEMALSVNPRQAEVLERLDALLSAQHRDAELAEVLKRRCDATRDPAQLIEIELRRAHLLEQLPGRSEDATRAYHGVIRLDPLNDEAHQRLCTLLRELRRHGELLDQLTRRAELLERSADSSPTTRPLWIEASHVAISRLSDPTRGATYLVRALRHAPSDPELIDELLQLGVPPGEELPPAALLEAAHHQQQAGRTDSAVRALRAALLLGPPRTAERTASDRAQRVTVARELVGMLDRLGPPSDEHLLVEALQVLHEEDPTPAERWRLGRLLAGQGAHEQAVAVLRDLPVAFEEAEPLLHDCLQRLGRYEELAQALEHHADTALRARPQLRGGMLVRAARVWAEQLDHSDRALQALMRAAEVEPLELTLVDTAAELLQGSDPLFDQLMDHLLQDQRHTPAMQARVQCQAASALRRTGAPWSRVAQRLEDAVQRDPGCLLALDGLVTLYSERADDQRLVDTLLQISQVAMTPTARAQALVRAATVVSERLRRPKDALELLQAAAELQPTDADILSRQVELLLVLGLLVKAENLLVTLAHLGHESVESLNRAVGLAHLRSDPESEVRYLRQLIKLTPRDRNALTRLSIAIGARGDFQAQASVLEQLASQDDDALLELAQLRAGPLQQLRGAHDLLEPFLSRNPGHPEALQLMLEVCQRQGRASEALEYLHQVRDGQSAQPPGADLSRAIAHQLEATGDDAAAEDAWRLALQGAPQDLELLQHLAHNLRRRQRWDELVVLLEQQLTRFPEGGGERPPAEIHLMLGETHLERGDVPSGIRHLELACKLAPDGPAGRRLLEVQRGQQDHVAVAQLLEVAVQRATPDRRGPLLEELAELQELHLKNLQAAARSYLLAHRAQSAARDAGDGSPHGVIDLGCAIKAQELFFRTNELKEALALLDELVPQCHGAQRGELHAARAHILTIQGLVDEAVAEYNRALQLHPDHHAARAELGRLLFELGRYDAAVPHLKAAAPRMSRPSEQESCLFLAHRAMEKLGLEQASSDGDGTLARAERKGSATRDMYQAPARKRRPTQAGNQPPPDSVAYPLLSDYSERTPAMKPDQWAALAERYRAEAVHRTNPDERTRLLIRAALIMEEHLDRPLEAYKVYEEAAATSPDDQTATEALADAAYRNQNWHRARELYDRLWIDGSVLPRHEIAYRRALVYETLGDEVTADLCYSQAISIKLDHRPALEGKARLALGMDDIPAAIDALAGLARLISLDETEELTTTRAKLGELYLRAQNYPAAREYLESALSLDPNQAKVMQTLLSVYQQLEQFEAMADLLERLIRATSNPLVRASLLHYRAEVLGGELGKEDAAVDCLLKAYDLAPHYPPTLWRLVDYYWERDDLVSVQEMGKNLRESTNLLDEEPDLRHVRLAAAAALDNDLEFSVNLLRVALKHGVLIRPTLVELARAVHKGLSLESVVQLVREADPEGHLARQATALGAERPDVPELALLAQRLS